MNRNGVAGPNGWRLRLRVMAEAARLAVADYWHERLMSACAVLGLAAVLAPLLVLFGVRYGLVSQLTGSLLDDPRNLEVVPMGSGHYERGWLDGLGQRPQAAFVIPQTRTIAATIELAALENDGGSIIPVSLIPTAAGDPLIRRWLPEAEMDGTAPGEGEVGVILSAPAAAKLGIGPGGRLRGLVGRVRDMKREADQANIYVTEVLASAAQQKDAAYVPLNFLLAVEDYRDGRAAPEFGWPGEAKPEESRRFASFRLYAAGLDEVAELRDILRRENIEVHTQAESIESVRNLSRALAIVFILIAGTAAAGLAAATVSSNLAAVRRKSRFLGLLRLMGYPRAAVMLFPLVQTLLTSVLGLGLSLLFYLAAALGIDYLFAEKLPGGEAVVVLLRAHVLGFFILTVMLSGLAALAAAAQAAKVEPSEVIRDL